MAELAAPPTEVPQTLIEAAHAYDRAHHRDSGVQGGTWTRVPDDQVIRLLVGARERIHVAAKRIAERIAALHPTPAELIATNAQSDTLCTTCISPAPCPTRRALDGED